METSEGNDPLCPSNYGTCVGSTLKSIYCGHYLFYLLFCDSVILWYFFNPNNASNQIRSWEQSI